MHCACRPVQFYISGPVVVDTAPHVPAVSAHFLLLTTANPVLSALSPRVASELSAPLFAMSGLGSEGEQHPLQQPSLPFSHQQFWCFCWIRWLGIEVHSEHSRWLAKDMCTKVSLTFQRSDVQVQLSFNFAAVQHVLPSGACHYPIKSTKNTKRVCRNVSLGRLQVSDEPCASAPEYVPACTQAVSASIGRKRGDPCEQQ